MLRKRAIAATLAVLGVAFIWSSGAEAAPTELTVRIEGAERTLFEGPIQTEGHDVRALSDTEPRPCDGTNNGAHPEPGPTPTAASVDAMELAGEDFDGQWYPGFDDYFIQQWGPDREDGETYAYWGVLVDGAFTPVGGCQYLAEAGDQVLWIYDAFTGRQPLWLAAAGDLGFPAAPTATVAVGEPLELTVEAGERASTSAGGGVTVAPVSTAAGTGYQTVEVASPAAVLTDSEGHASISFATPGWHRVKAQRESDHIRSNRLDVCVEQSTGAGCGPLPADAAVRVPPRYVKAPGGGDDDGVGPPGGSAGPAAVAEPSNRVRLGRANLDRGRGTATLSVTLPGPGRLVASGPKLVTRRLRSDHAGAVAVVLRPKRGARAKLRAKGRLAVTVRLAFTPREGEPGVKRRHLILRMGQIR